MFLRRVVAFVQTLHILLLSILQLLVHAHNEDLVVSSGVKIIGDIVASFSLPVIFVTLIIITFSQTCFRRREGRGGTIHGYCIIFVAAGVIFETSRHLDAFDGIVKYGPCVGRRSNGMVVSFRSNLDAAMAGAEVGGTRGGRHNISLL